MSTLDRTLRRQLENAVKAARAVAEAGAKKALDQLAVGHHEPHGSMSAKDRTLRNRLRAHGRQLGDVRDKDSGRQTLRRLTQECAYEHWHRMLFARFLAENHLLIEPEMEVALSLDECVELAREQGRDWMDLASAFAVRMLPQIFRADDPVLEVSLPPETRSEMEDILQGLPTEVFTADDSLGWVYQFWQAEEKKRVNESGEKIGADELPAVTQLFTEDYMVEFLLHNTLGAWWAGKMLTTKDTKSTKEWEKEEEVRRAMALPAMHGLAAYEWTYLRFIQEVARASSSGSSLEQDALATSLPEQNALATSLPEMEALVTSGPDWETLTIRKGENLPHWTCDNAIYHVNFRLADALPRQVLEEWTAERERLEVKAQKLGRPFSEDDQRQWKKLFSERVESYLDAGRGECLLKAADISKIVSDALQHFDGDRYTLHAWCVMPNHVHVIVEPVAGHDLGKIVHSWKSFTANAINKRLGRTGQVWQHEPYDHIIRSEKEYAFQLDYVWENPDKAGIKAPRWRNVARASSSDMEVARASSSGKSEEPEQDALATSFFPAAGAFLHWPKTAAELRVLDPCCGSGHFLVFALPILARMRMIEEGLPPADACDAVLRDNLFGLELDQRCTQIAAFNLALAAWKMVARASSSGNPEQDALATSLRLNIACSGLSVGASKQAWLKLAKGSPKLEGGLARLYDTFKQAPILGSLIDPRAGEVENALIHATFDELRPELDRALATSGKDDDAKELGVTAQGLMDAVRLLTAEYTLIITNVPYLARGKQEPKLRDFAERNYPEAKQDLATIFLRRCLDFVGGRGGILPPFGDAPGWRVYPGTVAAVTPQNWLFLTSYKKLREQLLKEQSLNVIVRLGPGAFETISGEVVNVALCILSDVAPEAEHAFAGLDASAGKGATEKATGVRGTLSRSPQSDHLTNADAIITVEPMSSSHLLGDCSVMSEGLSRGDIECFDRCFWELVEAKPERWTTLLNPPSDSSCKYAGRETVFLWESGQGRLQKHPSARVQGFATWGKQGVFVARSRELKSTLTQGHIHAQNGVAIVPKAEQDLTALWAFVASDEFSTLVRSINTKILIPTGVLAHVPFDLDHWQKVADEQYPHGLPEPYSDDPTQWIFHGHPCGSVRWNEDTKRLEIASAPRVDDTVLQVAVARVLGYKWPAELEVARASSSSKSPEQDALATEVTRASSSSKSPEQDALATEVTGASSSSKNPEQDALATTEQEQDALGTSIRLSEESRALVARCAELHDFADDDGIVCLSPIQTEAPAAQRVTDLLAAAYGDAWSAATLDQLLAASDAKGKTLDDWLRDKFFAQHCQFFHHRPFIWHVWDGLRDGFNALVNYHQLSGPDGAGKRTLDKLRYTYLGDWISRQRQDQASGVEGADARLAAALHLQKELDKIAEGDAPYDLFIRWKPLHEQPIGWAPDINDGVRLNIRPWMTARPLGARARDACILRVTPKNIKWKKDRGKEPQRDKEDYPWFWGWDEKTQDFTGNKTFDGNRWNDLHYSNAVKQAARESKEKG